MLQSITELLRGSRSSVGPFKIQNKRLYVCIIEYCVDIYINEWYGVEDGN